MSVLSPDSVEALAEALATAAGQRQTISLGGAFSKQQMAGPTAPAGVTISTAKLNRVLNYEPRDLTISVQAGLPYGEFTALLAKDGLMVPLDPPFADTGTVGGVVAANLSGPRRRLYGTARDLIIGMSFATLEGKLVQSGGMVVKNVAGLDMSKLMIGSFGTLAAIASVNFKLTPLPAGTQTFLQAFPSTEAAFAAAQTIRQSVLQPAAVDYLNPAASRMLNREGHLLALQASGSPAVLSRYAGELPSAEVMTGDAEAGFWRSICEFTPQFLAGTPHGYVVRVSTTLLDAAQAAAATNGPVVARAANGVLYGYFDDPAAASRWLQSRKGVIDFAPPQAAIDRWPAPAGDLDLMKKIKAMFDAGNLLNPGRLYGKL